MDMTKVVSAHPGGLQLEQMTRTGILNQNGNQSHQSIESEPGALLAVPSLINSKSYLPIQNPFISAPYSPSTTPQNPTTPDPSSYTPPHPPHTHSPATT
jgi:hypothetical protein